MKLRVNPAPLLALGLCGPGGLACSSAAQAPAYEDRLIGGGSLAPDISRGEETTSDTQGLARSLQLDGVVSSLSSHGAGLNSNVTGNGGIPRPQTGTCQHGGWC